MKGEIVTVWLPDGREITGKYVRYDRAAMAYVIECEAQNGAVTQWAIPERQVIAMGYVKDQS